MRRFFTALLIALAALACPAKTYIVCVGISDYPGEKNDLRVSANDARVMYNIFARNGKSERAILTNHKATAEGVKKAMKTVFAHASEDDVIILYFSGHGTPGALFCHDGILPYEQIFEVMKSCPAKNKIIFADACYSGQMRTESTSQQPPVKKGNVLLFLSSRSDEVSYESAYKNSRFTIYLERGLRGGADSNRDKIITAKELFIFVHKGVVESSWDRQHPVMWGNFDDNMPIINWNS